MNSFIGSRMRNLAMLLALLMLVSGCASRPGVASVGSEQAAHDATLLSQAITEFVVPRYPPAASTLAVTEDRAAKAPSALEDRVLQDLRAAGYAIAQDSNQTATFLRYSVRPLNGGVVLIVRTPTMEGSQWFARTSHGLEPGSYISIRQEQAE